MRRTPASWRPDLGGRWSTAVKRSADRRPARLGNPQIGSQLHQPHGKPGPSASRSHAAGLEREVRNEMACRGRAGPPWPTVGDDAPELATPRQADSPAPRMFAAASIAAAPHGGSVGPRRDGPRPQFVSTGNHRPLFPHRARQPLGASGPVQKCRRRPGLPIGVTWTQAHSSGPAREAPFPTPHAATVSQQTSQGDAAAQAARLFRLIKKIPANQRWFSYGKPYTRRYGSIQSHHTWYGTWGIKNRCVGITFRSPPPWHMADGV